MALSQCGRCRPSWGREAAPSRGPRPAERGRGETPAPVIGAHRRGCTRGGATARLALRRVPQRGPRGHTAPPLLPRGLSEVWQNPAHLTVCEREPCQLILFFKKQYPNLFFRFFFFSFSPHLYFAVSFSYVRWPGHQVAEASGREDVTLDDERVLGGILL